MSRSKRRKDRVSVNRMKPSSIILAFFLLLLMGCQQTQLSDYIQGPTKTTITDPDGTVTITEEAGQVNKNTSSLGFFANTKSYIHEGSSVGFAATSSGGTSVESIVANSLFMGLNTYGWIGIVLVLGGMAIGIFCGQWQYGVPTIITGGVFIGLSFLIATYPWMLLLMILGVLGVVVVMFVQSGKLKQWMNGLKETVNGVQNLKTNKTLSQRSAINTAIAEKQDKKTKDIVREIKRYV